IEHANSMRCRSPIDPNKKITHLIASFQKKASRDAFVTPVQALEARLPVGRSVPAEPEKAHDLARRSRAEFVGCSFRVDLDYLVISHEVIEHVQEFVACFAA